MEGPTEQHLGQKQRAIGCGLVCMSVRSKFMVFFLSEKEEGEYVCECVHALQRAAYTSIPYT